MNLWRSGRLWRHFSDSGHRSSRNTSFNKFVLRVMGKDSKTATYEDIDDARSKFRMITTTAIMLFALAGSIMYIQEGKKIKHDGGDSLYSRNKARYEKQDSDK